MGRRLLLILGMMLLASSAAPVARGQGQDQEPRPPNPRPDRDRRSGCVSDLRPWTLPIGRRPRRARTTGCRPTDATIRRRPEARTVRRGRRRTDHAGDSGSDQPTAELCSQWRSPGRSASHGRVTDEHVVRTQAPPRQPPRRRCRPCAASRASDHRRGRHPRRRRPIGSLWANSPSPSPSTSRRRRA